MTSRGFLDQGWRMLLKYVSVSIPTGLSSSRMRSDYFDPPINMSLLELSG